MATSSTTIRYAMPSTASAFHRFGSPPSAMADPYRLLDSSIPGTRFPGSSIAMGFSSVRYRVGPPPDPERLARGSDDLPIRSTRTARARARLIVPACSEAAAVRVRQCTVGLASPPRRRNDGRREASTSFLVRESAKRQIANERRHTTTDRLRRPAIGGCDGAPRVLIVGGIPTGGRQNDHGRTIRALHEAA